MWPLLMQGKESRSAHVSGTGEGGRSFEGSYVAAPLGVNRPFIALPDIRQSYFRCPTPVFLARFFLSPFGF